MPAEIRMLEDLEALVDQHGLRGVLVALADIARLKADHVQTNWQDKGLAAAWNRAGSAIDRTTDNPVICLLADAEGRRKDTRS